MSKKEPTEILSGMRDTILATALRFKEDKLGAENKGKLSANDLNAFSNAMRAAGYVESLRARAAEGLDIDPEASVTELSAADKKRLDDIAKLLSGEPVPKPRGKRGKKAPKEAEP